uniref:Somatostatin/Cortistatin C-terminal domain-containing protein n=1 Tax=Salarias fasciatus TaxID=181472 RepID=A0A672IZ04_SALFA
MARVLYISLLLCLTLWTVENTEVERGFESPGQDSWSQLDESENEQVRCLDFLMIVLCWGQKVPTANKLRSEDVLQESNETEKQESRRGAGGGFTKKPGSCRVFFWKSWASC